MNTTPSELLEPGNSTPRDDPAAGMRAVLNRIATGPELSKDLSVDQAREAMGWILEGRVDPVQAAVFLIALPLSFVGLLSLSTAAQIEAEGDTGEALRRRLTVHRMAVQVIGMIAIFVTAFWGMLQNYSVSILPG